jgi:CelD/BcsL family acetyltransferase involved in cellulose biosynthesis
MPGSKDDLRAEVLSGFDDPVASPRAWSELLPRGDTDAVNLTWHWQRAWWETFGHGRLLLIAVYRGDELTALAPFFADEGMIFNICPEDHLDFVGDLGVPAVLDAILSTARDCVEHFLGFRLYFIPDRSGSGARLQQSAERLGLTCLREDSLASPWLDIDRQRETAKRCAEKQSLRRHEQYFRREGELAFDVWTSAADVSPHLDEFFQQHIARRSATPHASLFCDARQRSYYRRLTELAAAQGWLRFARLAWNGRAIAYHFGLSYQGRYLWGIPSFDIALARHSPGEVLLRQVLLHALGEGASQFDLGPGDESYKHRFATNTNYLQTWGLYPRPARGRSD